MDLDLIFVIGVVIGAFSIPAFMSAFSDRRFPKGAFVMLLIGAGAVGYTVWQAPELYTLATVDDVFVSVIAKYLN